MSDLLSKGASTAISASGLGTIAKAAELVTGIFNTVFSNGKVSPNHWKDWEQMDKNIGAPLGTNAQAWVNEDGDSKESEAQNILSWITNYGIDTVVNYNSWAGKNFTMQNLIDKFRRGGLTSAADALEKAGTKPVLTTAPPSQFFESPIVRQTPITAVGNATYDEPLAVKKASIFTNVFVVFGLIGAAIWAVVSMNPNKKKRRR